MYIHIQKDGSVQQNFSIFGNHCHLYEELGLTLNFTGISRGGRETILRLSIESLRNQLCAT